MIFPEQHRPHTRQENEKGSFRSRQKSRVKIAALAVGGDLPQGLLELPSPEPLDLDGAHFVGLEVLQDRRREGRRVKELVPAVPLDLGLLPLDLELRIRLDLVELLRGRLAGPLIAVEEAEGGAKGRRRPRELEDVPPGEGFPIFFFSHGFMLNPGAELVKPK